MAKCWYCDRTDVVFDIDGIPLCPNHEDEANWEEDDDECVIYPEDEYTV